VIFCEDYETPIDARFTEYNDHGSFFRSSGTGRNGSYSMTATWMPGQVSAGWLLYAFGRTPPGFYPAQTHPNEDFREVYWREWIRMEPGWTGAPNKLSRVYGIANADWAQSVIAHLWNNGIDLFLYSDPASGIGTDNQLITTGYNDFANLRWLGGPNPIDAGWWGSGQGITPVYDTANADQWYCVEAHARLNTPGQTDGLIEFFVDDQFEAGFYDLNLVGTWQDYGINVLSLENYWNSGSPQLNLRHRDNLVLSTEPIGCIDALPEPDSHLQLTSGLAGLVGLRLLARARRLRRLHLRH
jgi:hypothetical protein